MLNKIKSEIKTAYNTLFASNRENPCVLHFSVPEDFVTLKPNFSQSSLRQAAKRYGQVMKNILLTMCMIAIASCANNLSELKYEWHNESNDLWYEATREKIIEQANLKIEKTSDTNVPGVQFLVRKYYNGGREFRREYLDNSEKIRGVILFSKNGDFELRNEIFEDGTLSFEGIVYKGEFYGLSRWWHSNGKVREVGRRFKGKSIGVWETYDENQNLIKAVDDGKTIQNDSLPSI